MSAAVRLDDHEIEQLLTDPDGPVGKDLRRRGLRVQRAIKRSLHEPGTGREYTRRGVTHQASSPGQPPATDTGQLAASITATLTSDEQGLVERVGSDLAKALPLEVGTRTMAARPFLRPALAYAADTPKAGGE